MSLYVKHCFRKWQNSFLERQIPYRIFVAQEYLSVFGLQNKLEGRILVVKIKICKEIFDKFSNEWQEFAWTKTIALSMGAKFSTSHSEMRLQLNMTGDRESMDLKLDIKEKRNQLYSEWRQKFIWRGNNQNFGMQRKF